jgi:hypothetical protein
MESRDGRGDESLRKGKDDEQRPDELEAQGFSAAEAARLARFREEAVGSAEYAEFEAIERRLRFVRWLVETGRLGG